MSSEKFSLNGKVAIVTGGSSGIGQAMASKFIEAGVKVALVGRSESRLRKAAINLPPDMWVPIECDVRDSKSIESMVASAEEKLGPIDILVNSAGVFAVASLLELDNDTWMNLWETNVNGTIFATRAVLPRMLERKSGYIVILSSVAAHRGYANMTGYAATKHAVTGFARALTTEVRRNGIKVINVYCGPVDTPIWEGLSTPLPSEEMLTSEEVANSIFNAMTVSEKQVLEDILLLPQAGLYF
tara:strand:- start:558 stop:1286 length:729 start_codon:yes stop_codon:yes gene_type:complete